MTKYRYKTKAWLSSAWIITLTSTMIGVIAGILLADYWQSQGNSRDQLSAMQAVKQELNRNHGFAQEMYETLEAKLLPLQTILQYKQGENLIIHRDSLGPLIEQTRSVYTYSDHTIHSQDSISLNGSLQFYLGGNSLMLFNGLSDINWLAYKSSGHVGRTPFDCVVVLEDIYGFQSSFSGDFVAWVKDLFSLMSATSDGDLDRFAQRGETIMLRLQILIQLYQRMDDSLEPCG